MLIVTYDLSNTWRCVMSIKYVILGYLGWQPMTGYDVKKLIADAETLPWTANNNQIYRALVDLHQDGWVDKQ
ncbi:MAG: PadR family transcriptional regulator, partial [Anaerolineales bacterium]|nr:PadR family transcriptional regulator [Anaerolineales bacterium]